MKTFPHFCCDGHEPIGFRNGPAEAVESCPVCLMRARVVEREERLEQATATIAALRAEIETLTADRDLLWRRFST